MNANKRYVAQKGNASRHSGKLKENSTLSASSSSVVRTDNVLNIDIDAFLNNIPIIKQIDNSNQLPKYYSVVARNIEDGVNMDDLDQLQLDLEKLISTCAVRQRFIRSESEWNEEERKSNKYDKNSMKRKRASDERTTKYKDYRNGIRPLKKNYPLPINSQLIGDVPGRNDVPRKNMPKNEISEKFWASVGPYCANIGPQHAIFLQKLIEECSQEIHVKIPELGEYYANEWNESATNEEQSLGMSNKQGNNEPKTNGNLNAMVMESFANPTTQKLLAALIEERVMTFPNSKLKSSDLGTAPRSALCMDRRLMKDLVEQGILNVEDLPTKAMPNDEILEEIRKCQQDLATVNEYNVQELKRLEQIVKKDLKRQDIQGQLDKVDNQILEIYNKILMTKQKFVQQNKEDEFDKQTFTKILKEYEGQTDALLKQQRKFQAELNNLQI